MEHLNALSISNPRVTAIGATRVSTPAQMKQYGPDRQVEDIESEARRLGLSLATVIHEQISGATPVNDRETIQTYFDLAEKHPGLHFIFPKVDRIGRKVLPILQIIEGLQERRAVVHVCGVQADSYSNQWWFMINQLSAMAQFDHGNIRENMARGKRLKAQSGQWAHGLPPYGFELIRDPQSGRVLEVAVVEAQAAAVRRIYELAVMYGAGKIKEILEAEGFPPPALPKSFEGRTTRNESQWSTTTIKNILKNPAYSGRYVLGRHADVPPSEWVITPVPVIVPLDQWERTRRILQTRAKERTSTRQGTTQLLSGFIRCAECGAALSWTNVPGKRADGSIYRSHYYKCWLSNSASAKRQNREVCQNKKFWRIHELDELAWEFLVSRVTDEAWLDRKMNGEAAPPSLDHSARIAELEAAIKRAFEPFAKGDLSYEVAQSLAQPYQEELRTLKAMLAVPVTSRPRVDVRVFSREVAAALRGALDVERKREAMSTFGVRFTVGPQGIVSMDLNY